MSISGERQVYRRASNILALFLIVLTVVSLIAGWFIAGFAGVWAALIGVGLAGLFCGGTMWSVTHTIGAAPISMAATIMLTWLAKLIILIAVLAFLRGRDFYHPQLLFAVIAVGMIGALIIQALTVKRSHLPYVEPTTGRLSSERERVAVETPSPKGPGNDLPMTFDAPKF